MAETDTRESAQSTEVGALITEYLQAVERAANTTGEERDSWRDRQRDFKARLNTAYWQAVFARVAQLVKSHPHRTLEFTDDDRTLIDFGWLDDRLCPKSGLTESSNSRFGPFTVHTLTQWLSRNERDFLESSTCDKFAEEAMSLGQDMSRHQAMIEKLRRHRRSALEDAPDPEGTDRLALDVEEQRHAIYLLDQLRRTRSLSKEEVASLTGARATLDRLEPQLKSTAGGLPQDVRDTLEKVTQGIQACRARMLDLENRIHGTKRSLQNATEKYRARLPERQIWLEERLLELKEDIKLCSKWGRTESYSVLLESKALNTKQAVVEAVQRIEECDPGLFSNRRAGRGGLPGVVLTPGTGHGSYDFRSNTLVIPVTSPRNLLESVAFALALYRRDIDQDLNEGKLWESFFSPDIWRGVKDREMPTKYPAQMAEFVNDYVLWATKEAQGLMVLDSEIRRWFEENIGPDKRSVLQPRLVRTTPVSERVAIAEAHEKDPIPTNLLVSATLRYLASQWAQAHELFEKLSLQNPDLAPVQWNLGILYIQDEKLMKDCGAEKLAAMRLKDRLELARTAFQNFIRLGGQSWWTLKAQEHVRKLTEQIGRLNRVVG